MEARNNEEKNQSNQHEDLIDHFAEENEEMKILKEQNERIRNDLNFERERTMREMRSKKKINERLKNDLNAKKQVNERIMKSQEDMNQLNQKNE